MKFGIREICNVVLKAKKDATILGKRFSKGQPVLWFDSLKTSGLEGTGEVVYARGGRGNTKLVSWTGDKDVTFTMEDALVSPMSLALLTAGSLAKAGTNNKIINHKTEDVEIDWIYDTDSATGSYNVPSLSFAQAKNTPIFYIYEGKGYSKVSELPAQEGTENKTIYASVDYYAEVESKLTQIDIAPDAFGANFYLEAETLFRDNDAGEDHAAEFIIPNCRVQSNFSFTMASTGDPSTFTFTMDVFPDYLEDNKNKKVLCAIQVFEEV